MKYSIKLCVVILISIVVAYSIYEKFRVRKAKSYLPLTVEGKIIDNKITTSFITTANGYKIDMSSPVLGNDKKMLFTIKSILLSNNVKVEILSPLGDNKVFVNNILYRGTKISAQKVEVITSSSEWNNVFLTSDISLGHLTIKVNI